MTVLSILRGLKPAGALQQVSRASEKRIVPSVPLRSLFLSAARLGGDHGPKTMHITPSRYNWQQYKDQLHFYIFLGVIPLSVLVFFVNVFIGSATLEEIPEGYEPKHWEYYPHPITRWLVRNFYTHPQEVYERNIHYVVEEEVARKMRLMEWKADRLIRERGDYPAFYQNRIFLNKYLRAHIKEDWENNFKYTGEI